MDNQKLFLLVVLVVAVYFFYKRSQTKEGYSGKVEVPNNLTVPSFEPFWVHLGWAFYDPFRYEQSYIPRYNWLFPDDYHVYNHIY